MTVENLVAMRSIAEAVVIARKAQGTGAAIPISPCVKVDQKGQTITCSNLDPTLKTLCTDPDGLMTERGVLVCPKQRGTLVINR
jgi:hypothetical protein